MSSKRFYVCLVKMSSKLNDLLRIPYDTLCQHAENFLEYLFPYSDDDQSTTTKDMVNSQYQSIS
jgi:hypothetical protein